MTTERKLEIHYAEEWAALYVHGELVRVGDIHNTEERAFELLGVKQVQDDAFMRGQSQRSGVAATVDEVDDAVATGASVTISPELADRIRAGRVSSDEPARARNRPTDD